MDRHAAYVALLKQPDEGSLGLRAHTFTQRGSGNRAAIKSRLAVAWLQHRLRDARGEDAVLSVRKYPMRIVRRVGQ